MGEVSGAQPDSLDVEWPTDRIRAIVVASRDPDGVNVAATLTMATDDNAPSTTCPGRYSLTPHNLAFTLVP